MNNWIQKWPLYASDYLEAWWHRLSSKNGICSQSKVPNLFSNSPLLVYPNLKREEFVELFGEETRNVILQEAEQIIQGQFPIFDRIEIDIGSIINWHKDYLSGKEYPVRYYRNVRPINLSTPDDPKTPWELSRFHHGLRLAQAFILTRDEKYVQTFLALFVDWCKKNPWKFGINWTSAMEVAIRAFNWIVTFDLMKKASSVTPLHLGLLKRSLQEHLNFILENLEWSDEVTTNHYIADLVGLIVISVCCPELQGTGEAEDFGYSELDKEVLKQFYNDGGNWESSTTYQRFVIEMLLLTALIAKRKGREFSEEFHQKLKSSVLLLRSIANDDGQIPQFGDNDSGRVIPFKQRKDTDIRHLGVIAALLYDDPNLIDVKWGLPEEAYWLFGKEGYDQFNVLRSNATGGSQLSIAFQEAGWYAMRDGETVTVISAGPNGQNGKGGHCHNDKLSFTVSVGGQEVITDPGTFTYSGNISVRRQFRSTNSHNTLMVDREEQNRYIETAIFWVYPDARVEIQKWESTDNYDIFDGKHLGYKRLADPVVHQRQIYFDKKESFWIIRDILNCNSLHEFQQFFHFTPLKLKEIENVGRGKIDFFLRRFMEVIGLEKLDIIPGLGVETDIRGKKFILLPLIADNLGRETYNGWTSQGYGIKELSPVLKYTKRTPSSTEFLTLMVLE